ncbi:hypothetical protein GCM10023211_08880 [Orbus sasakiae]|uniref:Uncharacterized protein n=1 Tax=Orbus sasakiae TaxID=1078475 RepID=A0ABP9N2U6_9GAMM
MVFKDKKRVTVNFKNEELYQKLVAISKAQNKSMSSCIESIIMDNLYSFPTTKIMTSLISTYFLPIKLVDKEKANIKIMIKQFYRDITVEIKTNSLKPEHVQKKVKKEIFEKGEFIDFIQSIYNFSPHFYTIIITGMNIRQEKKPSSCYFIKVNFVIILFDNSLSILEETQLNHLQHLNFCSITCKKDFEYKAEKNFQNKYSDWIELPFHFNIMKNGHTKEKSRYYIKLSEKKKKIENYSAKDPNFYLINTTKKIKIENPELPHKYEDITIPILINYIGIPYIPFLLSK